MLSALLKLAMRAAPHDAIGMSPVGAAGRNVETTFVMPTSSRWSSRHVFLLNPHLTVVP